MSSYLRYNDAKNDAHYKAVVDIAIDRLINVGFFKIDDVVDEAGLRVLSDALRWDYIKQMIEEDKSVELIPMAAAFFKRHTNKEVKDFPQRFIAGIGHAKKAVGFCLATQHNGQFTIRRLDHKRKLANGYAKAVNRGYDSAVKLGIPVKGQPYKIPLEQEPPAPQITGPTDTAELTGSPAEAPGKQSQS